MRRLGKWSLDYLENPGKAHPMFPTEWLDSSYTGTRSMPSIGTQQVLSDFRNRLRTHESDNGQLVARVHGKAHYCIQRHDSTQRYFKSQII